MARLLLGEEFELRLLDRDARVRRPGIDLLLHQWGQHPAGTDCVARDAGGGGFQRHYFGKTYDSMLGRNVGRLDGSAALVAWNTAERLIAMIASHFSSGKSCT